MEKKYKLGLVWLRRDYRLHDHVSLNQAVKICNKVIICFVFDTNILSKLNKNDQRISFIIDSLREIDTELNQHGTRLIVRHGKPERKYLKSYIITMLMHCFTIEIMSLMLKLEMNIFTRISKFRITLIKIQSYLKKTVLSKTGGYYKVYTLQKPMAFKT